MRSITRKESQNAKLELQFPANVSKKRKKKKTKEAPSLSTTLS